MAKRSSYQSRRRRERKSGISPYARYGKRPAQYSSAYHEWRASVTRHIARVNEKEHSRDGATQRKKKVVTQ
jgi:hypothetical protein